MISTLLSFEHRIILPSYEYVNMERIAEHLMRLCELSLNQKSGTDSMRNCGRPHAVCRDAAFLQTPCVQTDGPYFTDGALYYLRLGLTVLQLENC